MTRKERIRQIQKRLGSRKLVWFGTRGTDSRALLELPQFSQVFSIIAPLDSKSISSEVCLESLKNVRVDLELYWLSEDKSREIPNFRESLFASLGEPCVVVMYRANDFFTSIYYPRFEFVENLGQFHERQLPFEYKPWIETELRKSVIQIVPWQYISNGEREKLTALLKEGPIVLRPSRSSGGAKIALIKTPDELDKLWTPHQNHITSVAPYLSPNIPLNVNACVFQDGTVSLHSPSLQLIGLNGFTNRIFGYCGNDFAQVRELDVKILNEFESTVRMVGKWLARKGYIGAFGVDALAYNGKVYLSELNPRFQGSSDVSAILDQDLGRSDMFMEHMAAFFGLSALTPVSLQELAKEQRKISQVISHNCKPHQVIRGGKPAVGIKGIDITLLPKKNVQVDPDAILFRALIQDSVTEDGTSLRMHYESQLLEVGRWLFGDSPKSKEKDINSTFSPSDRGVN